MLDKIKITINGEELDLDEVVEMNEGEPLDAIDILEKVKYEIEGILNERLEHIRILDTSNMGGF